MGIGVSALSAGLSYGPVHAWAWLNQPVQLGLLLAALAALLLLPMPGRVCVLALMLVLVVQVLLLNAAPQNPYFAVTLQGWEQGRFIHFHGLAQWVGWLWPYAAFIYLLTRLGRPDGGQPPAEPARRSPVLAVAEFVALEGAQAPNSTPNPASPPMDTPMPPAPSAGDEPRSGA